MNHINQVLCRNRIADNKIGIKQIYKSGCVNRKNLSALYTMYKLYVYINSIQIYFK